MAAVPGGGELDGLGRGRFGLLGLGDCRRRVVGVVELVENDLVEVLLGLRAGVVSRVGAGLEEHEVVFDTEPAVAHVEGFGDDLLAIVAE